MSTLGGHERHFGLHTIVEHRIGTREAFHAIARLPSLRAQVQALADLTSEHAGGLLGRETIDLRQLYVLQMKVFKEREAAETGGSISNTKAG